MSKKKKGANIPPATMLRPRLDRLWADDALLHKEDAAVGDDLKALARDVSSKQMVRTMLRSYQAASETAQSRLDEVLPRWLDQSNLADTLNEITAAQSLDPERHSLALNWLEAAGMDTAGIESQPSLFLEAYYHDDEALLGEKSQAYVTVLWYTSPRKRRAQGLGFLLDYNPPWDGSVKDVLVTSRQKPKKLLNYIRDLWKRRDMELETISPERAKMVILTALGCNREVEMRLPRDMIKVRDMFERQVLTLPDEPDTLAFSMADFDFLANHGEYPEEVMNFEQTVGRRVRMDDGEEILVMDSFNWDDEEW